MPNVEGVGPEVEHITMDGGGKRSNTPFAFDQLPPRAMFRLARRFAFGNEKGYEVGNWKKLPISSFLQHGLQHIFAFMIGDTQEGDPVVHLEAALWNMACAVEVYLMRKENPIMEVESVIVTSQDVAIHDLKSIIAANDEGGKPFTLYNNKLKHALAVLEALREEKHK